MPSSSPATNPATVTVIPGDGIGPEVVGAARRVLDAAGAGIAWEERHAGARVFAAGNPTGVPDDCIESIARTRVVLKGPLATPVGYGEKSANVTLRKRFETYANVRPVREMPGVRTPFSGRGVDLVVVRENVEDLYAGIEYLATPNVAEGVKLVSAKGCEKICRFAFEYAVASGRGKVQCATKANILKLTEGLLKRTFERVATEYPAIESSHIIVDNYTHNLHRSHERFDVIVTTNMNGDILSDLTSGLIGGLGFAPGANIGSEVAIFEAVHGTAPDIAGLDLANPTALLLSAVMMLRHLGRFDVARRVEQALVATFEQGVLTGDAGGATGTKAFTDAVIGNLGRESRAYASRPHRSINMAKAGVLAPVAMPAHRRVTGVDVFLESSLEPEALGRAMAAVSEGSPLTLKSIANRGAEVYPGSGALTDCVDQFRCRFMLRTAAGELDDEVLLALLARIRAGHRWSHVEKLQEYDGVPAYTRAQGED